jgi:hypothetical protein
LAEKWRSDRRRGGAALQRTTALDGSRDGGCARLDDRRRCELVRDDEDGAQRQRVARGRRPRLALRRLEEVVSRGDGSVRRMGMAAWGCGTVLWTAVVLSEWRGRSASNAARADKVATAVGCRARQGLQVEGDA